MSRHSFLWHKSMDDRRRTNAHARKVRVPVAQIAQRTEIRNVRRATTDTHWTEPCARLDCSVEASTVDPCFAIAFSVSREN